MYRGTAALSQADHSSSDTRQGQAMTDSNDQQTVDIGQHDTPADPLGEVAIESIGRSQTDAAADPDTSYETVDTTAANDATFDTSGDPFVVEASGYRINNEYDEYAAIYQADAISDGTTVTTTLDFKRLTYEWARAGIMVANDITDPGGSPGDVAVGVTESNGFRMQWDDDGSGFQNEGTYDGVTQFPCQVRLVRNGQTFVGKYSTDDGQTWQTLAVVDIEAAGPTQDVGLFASSYAPDTRGHVEFSQFDVAPTTRPSRADSR